MPEENELRINFCHILTTTGTARRTCNEINVPDIEPYFNTVFIPAQNKSGFILVDGTRTHFQAKE